jgi:glutaredoxin
MQCAVHGIAGGPDGRCALCHTLDRVHDRRQGARLGWILFLSLGTASAGLLAVHELVPLPGQKSSLLRAEPARVPARPASENQPGVTDTIAPASAPASDPTAVALDPREDGPPPAESDVPAPTAPASAAPGTSPVAAQPKKLSDAELHAALVATPITMYSAPWCGTCRRAHEFLQQNGLRWTDRNVDDDPSAMRELRARSGGTAIPVIDVDGKLLRAGFDARAIAQALSESVERRFRTQGIAIRAKSL